MFAPPKSITPALLPSDWQPTNREQTRVAVMSPGLQIQNWDRDDRAGALSSNMMTAGTLGLIIYYDGNQIGLTTSHVVGKANCALGDRIFQPGSAELSISRDCIGKVISIDPAPASLQGAHPRLGNVAWGRSDAAAISIPRELSWNSHFPPEYKLRPVHRIADHALGAEVFKVGRTTSLTRGRITSVGDRVGPISDSSGSVWYRGLFCVESENGPFSLVGDAGAAVVTQDGGVCGIILASNGVQSFAIPITEVLAGLQIRTQSIRLYEPLNPRRYGEGLPPCPISKETFMEACIAWKAETLGCSSAVEITSNRYFQMIVSWGPTIIPFIIEQMLTETDLWGPALERITGAGVASGVPPDDLTAVENAWVHWYQHSTIFP